MKKLLYFTVIAIIFVFSSCNNEAIDVITTSCDSIRVNALTMTQSFTIDSDASWTVESSEEWCTLSDSSGIGMKGMLVTCKDNQTGLIRSAQIIIRTANRTKSIAVTQGGGNTLLEENFANNNNNWIFQNDSIIEDINDGALHIKNRSSLYYYMLGNKSIMTNPLGSYIIDASFKFVSEGKAFGLYFGGKNSSNYIGLLVYPYWGSVLYKMVDGVYTRILEVPSDSWVTDVNLKITKFGNKGAFFINDQLVGNFSLPTLYGAYVGFLSYPQSEVLVDNLKVNQL